MTDKYKNKKCWAWKDEVICLGDARQQCAECNSKECKRRVPNAK